MTIEDLKKISLSTKLYHPFLGMGKPIQIGEQHVNVKFKEGIELTFSLSYITEKCTGLEHIYLNPVKIIEEHEF